VDNDRNGDADIRVKVGELAVRILKQPGIFSGTGRKILGKYDTEMGCAYLTPSQ